MSTTIRPEVSKKNENWIPRHRYYELKHFCMQYPGWKKAYELCDGYRDNVKRDMTVYNVNEADPTAYYAELAERYDRCIKMVENAATLTHPNMGKYILRAVTTGMSFDALVANTDMKCGKDAYYSLYRRFFYILDQLRQ